MCVLSERAVRRNVRFMISVAARAFDHDLHVILYIVMFVIIIIDNCLCVCV